MFKAFMKVVLISVIAFFTLTGCVGLKPDLGKSVYESQEGFIERFVSPNLAEDDYKNAYNVQYLLNRGNDVTFLISDVVDLSDTQYFGKKARLSGNVYSVEDETLMNVDDILVLTSPPVEDTNEEKSEDPEISETPEASDEGNLAAVSQTLKESIGKKITKFEFVEPNYVYVYWENSRELLTYEISDAGVTTEQIASFKPGTVRDWDIVSGEDPVASRERSVITVSDDDVIAQVTTVQEGFRYLESKPLKFRIQYPASWYYARSGSGYAFSNESVDDTNVILTLKVGGSSVSDSISKEVEGTLYQLIGPKEHKDLMETMIETVEVLK